MNTFLEKASLLAREEFGGEPPAEVLRIAAAAESEVRRILTRTRIDPNAAYLIEQRMADALVKVMCAALNLERSRGGGPGWYTSGFGSVNPYPRPANGGEKP